MAELNPRLAVYPGTFDPLTMGPCQLGPKRVAGV